MLFAPHSWLAIYCKLHRPWLASTHKVELNDVRPLLGDTDYVHVTSGNGSTFLATGPQNFVPDPWDEVSAVMPGISVAECVTVMPLVVGSLS